jgi:hypothetical protein
MTFHTRRLLVLAHLQDTADMMVVTTTPTIQRWGRLEHLTQETYLLRNPKVCNPLHSSANNS